MVLPWAAGDIREHNIRRRWWLPFRLRFLRAFIQVGLPRRPLNSQTLQDERDDAEHLNSPPGRSFPRRSFIDSSATHVERWKGDPQTVPGGRCEHVAPTTPPAVWTNYLVARPCVREPGEC